MLLRVFTCCYIFRGENVSQSWFQVPILYSFPTHEYLVTYLHWACYVLLRVVTCCYILRGENVCQSTFKVPILYSFPTHVLNTLLHRGQNCHWIPLLLVSYVHWACYVLLRVVACCYIFRGENVCQSTFQVPILYSFPTHEYLVAYGHWACYVLLRVFTCCYIFRGENVCQSWFQVPILYSFPTH